jgi:hypothetical protein
MSGHDSKYFSTTKKGEIPELKEELNSQYKVSLMSLSTFNKLNSSLVVACSIDLVALPMYSVRELKFKYYYRTKRKML